MNSSQTIWNSRFLSKSAQFRRYGIIVYAYSHRSVLYGIITSVAFS